MDKTTISKDTARRVPYDTGKVKIGMFYEPPKPRMDTEELLLQNLLLGVDTPSKPPLLQRILSNIGVSVGFGIIFTLYLLVLFRS